MHKSPFAPEVECPYCEVGLDTDNELAGSDGETFMTECPECGKSFGVTVRVTYRSWRADDESRLIHESYASGLSEPPGPERYEDKHGE